MSEVVLIVYPILLLGYLMLAARWQPKGAPQMAEREDEFDDSRRHGGRRRH